MDAKKIKQWIVDDNIDAVETAWMEAVEANEPLPSMREALDAMVAAERPDTAEMLAWMLLSEAVEQRPAEEALDVARKTLPALPGNDDLRTTAADLYARVHGEAEHFQSFMDASGLLANQSPRRAIRTLDTSLAALPGTYLVNRFDHQVVRVKGFDDVMGQFELLAGGRTTELEPKLLADEFDPVDETDFRVLCQFRTDELGELIQKDIASVLIGICMSHGGRIAAPDLKDLLVGKFLETDKWSGWWNRARTAARRSESLSLEGRNPTTVCSHPH